MADKEKLYKYAKEGLEEVTKIHKAIEEYQRNSKILINSGQNIATDSDSWITEFETLAENIEPCINNIKMLVKYFDAEIRE